MKGPFKPTPPDGYRLHRQVLDGDKCSYEPHIPVDGFASLLVFNGWQDRWEKPAFIFTGESAWLATKEP